MPKMLPTWSGEFPQSVNVQKMGNQNKKTSRYDALLYEIYRQRSLSEEEEEEVKSIGYNLRLK